MRKGHERVLEDAFGSYYLPTTRRRALPLVALLEEAGIVCALRDSGALYVSSSSGVDKMCVEEFVTVELGKDSLPPALEEVLERWGTRLQE